MTTGKRLCLNMIVKNEMANLQRCLGAVVDHIDCWVIGDTGSTDGTQDFIRAFFAARNLPGELHEFPFENFEQARNAALDHAYASSLAYDYLLFDDADMELVVEDAGFRAQLDGPGYRLLQRSGSDLAYWNTRIVRRDAGARYHGVTHEYLDVPGDVKELRSVWYKDHASGSNRVDKFERDIKLLLEALEKDPENHRYWFYLAQSYRDAGRTAEAAVAYAKRAAMGGWDEEAWNARLQEARCLKNLGDDAGFIRQALAAFNQRPQRAEPLYDLARFHREKGMNEASVLFSEAGLAIGRPEQDILFLEDFIYTTGLREEYAIAANYARDPLRKDRGFAACNWLALNRGIADGPRDLARSNLFFYIQSAKTMMPSFTARPVEFTPPDGYRLSNPSVARWGDKIVLLQGAVGLMGAEENLRAQVPDRAAVHTRNFLLRIDNEFGIASADEISQPADLPRPAYDRACGLGAMRPFAWEGQLWSSAYLRASAGDGRYDPVIARIDDRGPAPYQMTDWRVLRPIGAKVNDNNWAPLVKPAGIDTDRERLQFFSVGDPIRIVGDQGQTISEKPPSVAADQLKGGTQAIAFEGGWLALVHETRTRPDGAQRYCQHRFVWLDETGCLAKISRPFFLNEKGVEFAAGLAWHPKEERLLISYGVADREAWIAVVDASEVSALLEATDNLPSSEDYWSSPAMKSLDGANVQIVEAQRYARPGPGDRRQQHRPGGGLSKEASSVVLSSDAKSTEEVLLELAPFLRFADSPHERRAQSRAFDSRIAPFLGGGDAALPQIHCFYEVLSDNAKHLTLVAATTSMRAAGHPVRVWSYSPNKLEFLLPLGIEVRAADDVMPRSLFERMVAGSEIRYFSDAFRYAVLYEHGGLWMDCDVVMLRPFPFRGDYFFNLQWRGGHQGHFICGNVIYAEAFSHHLRALYEMSIERFYGESGKGFGEIGPKLLSDYIASDTGAELREWVFGPMFFNSIDWTEISEFEKPLSDLAVYLNDERVVGTHLWTARNEARSNGEGAPLISLLIEPLQSFPTLINLADRFNTDKNRHTGNRHAYARVYERLLSSRRLSMRGLMEIGLCRIAAEGSQSETPSVSLWQSYFPYAQVIGVDLTDFSQLNNERFKSFVCDQSKLEDLRSVAEKLEPGSLDVIIDDGSHASFDEQLTLREFFPLLAEGGWYFIEDLDWQPPGEDASKITLTKNLLREIQQHGTARSLDPMGISDLADQFAEIRFFDSHFELSRAKLLGGLVAIRKRGGVGLVR
ncbi:glycosyltransferase [Mesorhizobium silamurunense]|uniref:glycosyltransferase n=1 Tax=Mesorhizobium silamurunense TaxID=499528 RepID=UPI001780C8B9|nr:glycosyltransferase [Mesorhizobium silamurunense]